MDANTLETINKIIELKAKIELLKERQRSLNHTVSHATAVIVEPRKHKALAFVLKNVLENLDITWGIQIHHGSLNKEFIQEIIDRELTNYASRITLVNLGIENLTAEEYNTMLQKKEFIESIPTETFLVFQTDSMINPRYKDLIYTFLKYEYVGAPWVGGGVGNGGFSLRRKSKCLQCLGGTIYSHEDMLYSNPIHGLYKPPHELASLFSVETVYSRVFFGVHCPWKYHSSDIMKEMCNNCPGLSELIELQGVYE
jgi:hypothetical protein